MYHFSGFGATSDADYFMNRGCTPGYPPADELAKLQAIKALKDQYDAAKIACGANNTGPAVGGCLGGIAQKFVPQITSLENAFSIYCASKLAPPPPPPPPPPTPTAPPPPAAPAVVAVVYPAPAALPAIPSTNPLSARGYICPNNVTLPQSQAAAVVKINDAFRDLQAAVKQCAFYYGPQMANVKSHNGPLSEYLALDKARVQCVRNALGTYSQKVSRAMAELSAACSAAAAAQATPTTTTTTIPKTIMPSQTLPPVVPKTTSTTSIPKTVMPSQTLPPVVPKTVVTPPPTYTPPPPSYPTAPEVTEQLVFTSAPAPETGEQYVEQPTLEEGEDVGTKKKASLVVGGILLLLLAGGGYAVYRATRKGK